jgi:hypothetical protein
VSTSRADALAPRLARMVRAARAEPASERRAREAEGPQCDLCSAPLAADHRHLLDLSARRLACACRACAILFADSAAGGRHYRLVPDRVSRLTDIDLDDAAWAALAIPVDMAFFFLDGAAGRIVALYPSPAGATESRLPLAAWDGLAARNPVLAQLEPDVEAFLVDRTRGAREYWLLPVDVCYALVGLIRTHWKGLAGGEDVWREIDRFFAELRARAGRAAASPIREGEAR